jgi:D-aminoacyl-tRNA deacylase
MKTAIIISNQDMAGKNIKTNLLEMFDFVEFENEKFENNKVYELENIRLYTTEKDSIYCENIDEVIDADLFVFATQHSSDSEKLSLCVHTPGNWNKAELGGAKRKVNFSAVNHVKSAFLKIKELAKEQNHMVAVEQTHHGPEMQKPVFFIEIGNNENYWGKKELGKIIAKALMHAIKNPTKVKEVGIILGGGHYNQAAEKILMQTDIGISHICAKFLLEDLDKEIIMQSIAKSEPKASMIILDWKGLGQYKQHVKKIVEEIEKETGIRVVRAKEVYNKLI